MKFAFAVVMSTLMGAMAQGASVKASCYLQDADGQQLEGVNVDRRYEIASVSKVMTTYWAVKTRGMNARFTTTIYTKKIGDDLYDVHLAGSRDPYMGKTSFQFIVSELNKMGIDKIRNLTFDEKFKFIQNVRSNSVACAHYVNSSPSAATVMSHLRSTVKQLQSGYSDVIDVAGDKYGMSLPKKISLKVENIELLSRKEFSPEGMSTYQFQSAPMSALVKEMNRNSNNHAANQIFESMGGASAFSSFIQRDLGLEEREIRFLNGSGDRHDLENGQSVYNEATCRAVVKIVRALNVELKKNGRTLQEVMAVAGDDTDSTVSKLYNNDMTEDALIAKTGTVNPAVSLAGMISTEEGNVFFGYIMGTKGSGGDWRDGRNKIRGQVIGLSKKFGGPKEISYRPKGFLSFDKQSSLRKMESAASSADAGNAEVVLP